jgi:hypothetical protein
LFFLFFLFAVVFNFKNFKSNFSNIRHFFISIILFFSVVLIKWYKYF